MTPVDAVAADNAVRIRKSPGPSRRRAGAGRLFVAPNLIAVATFMLFPLAFSLYMSFQNWDLFRPPKFVGLKNFAELFTSDPLFLIAILNTVIFTLGTVVPTVLISLVVAGALNRKVRGIGFFRTVVFLPLAISSVVMAVVWQFVFNTDNGLLNIMLGWIGVQPDPVAGRPEVGDGFPVPGQRMAQRAVRHGGLTGRDARRSRNPLRGGQNRWCR